MQTAGYNLYRARGRTEERQRPTPPAHKTSGPTTARRSPDTQRLAFAKKFLAKTKLALTGRRREGREVRHFATRRLWRNGGIRLQAGGAWGGGTDRHRLAFSGLLWPDVLTTIIFPAILDKRR